MKSRILLYGLIGLLVLVATAPGVFYRTPGVPIEYLTVRGERDDAIPEPSQQAVEPAYEMGRATAGRATRSRDRGHWRLLRG